MTELPLSLPPETRNFDPPASVPAPGLPKLSEAEVAALRAYYRLRKRNAAGELAAYAGEYVVSDGQTIFAHGPSLVDLFPHAEEVAAAAGVPAARLVHFFVAGPE